MRVVITEVETTCMAIPIWATTMPTSPRSDAKGVSLSQTDEGTCTASNQLGSQGDNQYIQRKHEIRNFCKGAQLELESNTDQKDLNPITWKQSPP